MNTEAGPLDDAQSPVDDAPDETTEEQADTDEIEQPQEGDSDEFDSGRALEKIRNLNSENRNLRARAKDAEEKASGSEELSKTNESQAAEILRLRVALKHGLPEKLVGRLSGTTEEELLADAEDLMGLFVTKEPPSQLPKTKARQRTADSAEDGVDIDQLSLSQLSE